MEDTTTPKPCTDDLHKHVMKLYRDLTKDCEDKALKKSFDSIVDYDGLNYNCLKVYDYLAHHGMAEDAKEIFKPPCKDDVCLPVLPDVAVYTMVIREYFYAGNSKAALEVFNRMLADGVTPVPFTYSQLIMSLAKDSSADVNFIGYAKKYFLEMLDKGMKPNSGAYMTLFNGIACRESAEKAKEFLEEIQAKGFTPGSDVHHFEESHLTEATKAMRMYDDLVSNTTDKEMQKFFRKWRKSSKPFEFTKAVTIEMISALIRDGYADKADEVFKTTFGTKIYPMVAIHTSVIQAYFTFGKTKGALEAYQAMLASGVAPNSYTYTVLIKGLTVDPNFCGDAKKCMLDMMNRGIRPNVATYTAVIEGFARQEDKASEEEARDLVEVMMSRGLVPDSKAMMQVLRGRPTPQIRKVIDIALSKLKG